MVLESRAPLRGERSRSEVLEFFWYGCPHCYTLEPHLVLWYRSKPAFAMLRRIPEARTRERLAHARLYYVLLRLGREDLHQAVFEAIHRFGIALHGPDDASTFQQQCAFLSRHGVDETHCAAAYRAPGIEAELERARQLAMQYRIEHIPTLVIGGKYTTGPYLMDGNERKLIDVVRVLSNLDHEATRRT